jgi:hypothetical protein
MMAADSRIVQIIPATIPAVVRWKPEGYGFGGAGVVVPVVGTDRVVAWGLTEDGDVVGLCDALDPHLFRADEPMDGRWFHDYAFADDEAAGLPTGRAERAEG